MVTQPSSVVSEYEHARRHAALFDLTGRGQIEVVGPDAAAFLHNLCTNDIKNLPIGSACEAFFCNAKARVIAYTLVYRSSPDQFWVDVAPGRNDTLYRHLDHYRISEQVELIDRTDEFGVLHLAGPKAPTLRDIMPGEAGGQVRRHEPLGLPGFDMVLPRSQIPGVRDRLLAAGAAPASLETYRMLRIEAGTPVDGEEIDADRFVVEVGRGSSAICPTKGCYLGQEPIVMARDRGHVNRQLLGLRFADDAPVLAGAMVRRGSEEVGTVMSAVRSPALGVTIALAYLRRGCQEPGTAVEVVTPGGTRAAVVASLPFVGSPA
ncbi:MAG: hypothetical protein NZ700_10675 [Gemmataceae bacterium]|nr:hypothetical protein [Gemmataceae bacterium]MDW8264453.1 glycine cleavage T C-terminal barrel domain-containing protein [Gemmataceae bacterium]